MWLAARYGHESIVRLMLYQGANNHFDAMAATSTGDHKNILRLLLDHAKSK